MNDALPSFLGRVVSTTAALQANRFCKVVPATVLGAEVEGASGTWTDSVGTTTPVLVYLLGSFVPSSGDSLVCRFVDHRWVAELTGGSVAHGSGGITLPNCFCEIPPVLQMTSGDEACNFRMFQSCTISYGPPKPSMVAVGLTAYGYSSDQLFPDPLTGTDFFYYFACQYNQFYLSRLYPVSSNGTVYHDGILYNWIVGGYGNSCTPFNLEYGMPFPGSDASCSVTITGS